MKTFLTFSAFSLSILLANQALAHDIHDRASDHYHPGNLYTHSVSSTYDHYNAHQYNDRYSSLNHHNRYANAYIHSRPKVTTNTATYYTRNYPVKQTYSYHTTPNTTIHQPPFAYSSCAHRCDQTQKRITVSRNLGSQSLTYRAPSEYSAQERIVVTPNRHYRSYRKPRTTTHVSPYRTHKLTTTTCYDCY